MPISCAARPDIALSLPVKTLTLSAIEPADRTEATWRNQGRTVAVLHLGWTLERCNCFAFASPRTLIGRRNGMMESESTYRAVQAVAPGRLELVRKPIRDPGPGEVRIRIEACGVCHSDSVTVEGVLPIEWPRVPGHEAVGRIDVIAEGVEGWAVGQRVGVGFLGG